MILTSDDIKACVAAYFRYARQYPLVCFEASPNLDSGYSSMSQADILAVDKQRMLYEVEVKISISDLKANRYKFDHHSFELGNYRNIHQYYFAVPYDIARDSKDIIDTSFPYAGILSVRELRESHYAAQDTVSVIKHSRVLSTNKLSLKEIVRMSWHQSGTLCRAAHKVCRLERQITKDNETIKELQDELKLYKPTEVIHA